MSSLEKLPGSPIRWRESGEELVLHLPWRLRSAIIRTTVLLAPLVILAAGLLHPELDLPLLVSIPAVSFLAFLLLVGFVLFVGPQMKETRLRLLPARLVLTTRHYGREREREYHLSETSYARQHQVNARSSGAPHGIDISSRPETAHFGDSLSRGELDWVEWRINRFLGQPTNAEASAAPGAGIHAVAAIEGLPDERLAPSEDIKIRMEEDRFQTHIHFPSEWDMHSLNGIGSAVFGTAWSGYFVFTAAQAWGRPGAAVTVVVCVVIAFFGLLFLLTGIGQLFGRSCLSISPEKITFRTTVLGLGPWTTLATADVISVGSTNKPRTRSGRLAGPAKGHVIRTARNEIRFGERLRTAARNQADADWVTGEIALRIHAARSGATATLQYLRPSGPAKPLEPPPTPPPTGLVPYGVDRRSMPDGEDLDVLLPAEAGPFRRTSLDAPDQLQNAPVYAHYRSDEGKIFVELGICAGADDVQRVIATAHAEVSGYRERADDLLSLNTDPSYFKSTTPRGVFMAWSRGNYYFSASVDGQNCEDVFDRFMKVFPY